VRRDLELARWFAARVDAAGPGWERMAEVTFQTVCLRHRPEGLWGEALDRHNLKLAEAINTSGRAYVTASAVKGVQLIRASFGSALSTRADAEALWAIFREEAAKLGG